jgi:hypothetical protein
VWSSIWGKLKVKDAEGNVDYEIDTKVVLGGDTYVVKVLDPQSEIPLEWAIFVACIEDAIKDAEEQESDDD